MLIIKIRASLVVLVLLGMIVSISGARAQSDREENSGNVAAPVDPPRPDVDEDKLFTELLAHNQQRNATLLGYTEQRTYRVTDTTGKVRAEESGQMEYHAPDKKTFVTSSESGSGIMRRMALKPLIASEIETTSGCSITIARALLRITHLNFLVNNKWGPIAASWSGRRQNGQTSICLKERCGSIPKTTPSSGSRDTPQRNFLSG